MIEAAAFKQCLKDATDDEAKALYGWATACMEVRGLIAIEGAPKPKRSDAGKPRKHAEGPSYTLSEVGRQAAEILNSAPNAAQPTVESVREPLQPSLSGLPDEDQK